MKLPYMRPLKWLHDDKRAKMKFVVYACEAQRTPYRGDQEVSRDNSSMRVVPTLHPSNYH